MVRERDVLDKRHYQRTHLLGRTCDGIELGRRCGEPIYDNSATGRCRRHPKNARRSGTGVPQTPVVNARRYEG